MRRDISASARIILPCWLMFLPLFLPAASARAATPDFPPLSGRVVDQAGILSPATRDGLTEMLAQHERASGEQVVVVTLKSLGGDTIEDYGYQLGRHWGIGEKDKNTGAILIVAPAEHKVRIEVGYGLEGKLTDAASRTIIEDAILPSFRTGDFSAGVVAGTSAILTVLGNPPTGSESRPRAQAAHTIENAPLTLLLLMGFWVAFLIWRFRPGTSLHRRLGGPGPMIFPGGFYRGGGFNGGGGFSGGGFSGGGGSFGGGGASGGW
jgi:uncharacterized protein